MEEVEQLFGGADIKTTTQIAEPCPPPDLDADFADASDIQSGDRLLALGRPKDALAVYFRHLDGWVVRRSRGHLHINQTAIANRDIAIDRICDLAVIMIQEREYAAACDAARRALSAKEHASRANICLAHGMMFLGNVDEARELYRKCGPERLDAERTGKVVIIRDFAAIREAELKHSLMDEVERGLTPRRTVVR
jgi:tetratricopeptide (TPR) repeat protein